MAAQKAACAALTAAEGRAPPEQGKGTMVNPVAAQEAAGANPMAAGAGAPPE
jgi:hypothetical protein